MGCAAAGNSERFPTPPALSGVSGNRDQPAVSRSQKQHRPLVTVFQGRARAGCEEVAEADRITSASSDLLGEMRLAGRNRLPSGEPRKASQKRTRPAEPMPTRINRIWRSGEQVTWQGRTGVFRREAGDGEHVEIILGERIYRVRTRELS